MEKYLENDVFSDSTDILSETLDYSEKNKNISIDIKEKEFIKKLKDVSPFKENNELVRLFANLENAETPINKIRRILTLNEEEIEASSNHGLGQYTSARNLKYLITKEENPDTDSNNNPGMRTLRLTNANQLNDPKEGKIFWDILKEIGAAAEVKKDDDYEPSDIFLSSTTAAIDILPMWKQYGDDGKGLFLKYSSDYLTKLCNSATVQVRRVCYLDWDKKKRDFAVKLAAFPEEDVTEKEEELKTELNKLKNSGEDLNNLETSIKDIVYAFKRKEYSYENEFRIFINLENKDDRSKRVMFGDNPGHDVKFLYTTIKNKDIARESSGQEEQDDKSFPVNYDEVIVGPVAEDIDYIAPYIKECDRNIRVTKSKILYR